MAQAIRIPDKTLLFIYQRKIQESYNRTQYTNNIVEQQRTQEACGRAVLSGVFLSLKEVHPTVGCPNTGKRS